MPDDYLPSTVERRRSTGIPGPTPASPTEGSVELNAEQARELARRLKNADEMEKRAEVYRQRLERYEREDPGVADSPGPVQESYRERELIRPKPMLGDPGLEPLLANQSQPWQDALKQGAGAVAGRGGFPVKVTITRGEDSRFAAVFLSLEQAMTAVSMFIAMTGFEQDDRLSVVGATSPLMPGRRSIDLREDSGENAAQPPRR